jgi:hypothetical protein
MTELIDEEIQKIVKDACFIPQLEEDNVYSVEEVRRMIQSAYAKGQEDTKKSCPKCSGCIHNNAEAERTRILEEIEKLKHGFSKIRATKAEVVGDARIDGYYWAIKDVEKLLQDKKDAKKD